MTMPIKASRKATTAPMQLLSRDKKKSEAALSGGQEEGNVLIYGK